MLHKSDVIFDPEAHTYSLNGVSLSGITGMINRQIFPDKYNNIPKEVLEKAAERGRFIHEVCQTLDDIGCDMGVMEAQNYLELKLSLGLSYVCSEYLVSDNKHFASCIDKVYKSDKGYSLGDIKTTYKLDKDYLRWQLSVYAYFFELNNPELKVDKLFGIWLRGHIAELVDIERIPDEIIIRLLECEVNGEKFINPYFTPDKINLPDKYRAIEETIIEINEQAKYWAEKKKELTDGIMQEMVKAGVYNWQGESIQFVRKKDSIRKLFDKESFEKDYPGVYNKYLKESPVVGSVTLKIN